MLVLKTNVDNGERKAINKINYKGFGICTFVRFLWLVCAQIFLCVLLNQYRRQKQTERDLCVNIRQKWFLVGLATNGLLFILLTFAWLMVIHDSNQCNDVCWLSFSLCLEASSHYRQWMQLCCIHCISNLLRLRVCAIEHDHTFFCPRIKCHLRVGHLQTKGHQPICRYKQSKIRSPSPAVQEIE